MENAVAVYIVISQSWDGSAWPMRDTIIDFDSLSVQRDFIMDKLKDEFIEKARNAKTAEEFASIAKENGIALTEKDANMYFTELNSKAGELADDELDNVAGGIKCGTVYKDGWPVVIPNCNSCEYYNYNQSSEYLKDDHCTSCVHRGSIGIFPVCKCPKRYESDSSKWMK